MHDKLIVELQARGWPGQLIDLFRKYEEPDAELIKFKPYNFIGFVEECLSLNQSIYHVPSPMEVVGILQSMEKHG